jgi:succinate dehydrogenase / fumarate reductase cytochrome b subunit
MSLHTKKRPLSPFMIPHFYKLQMTSGLSILHRMTGMANTIGLLLFAWWMIAAVSGPDAYAQFIDFITSPFGYVLLFGWTLSVTYHMCNGVRHLIWDTGAMLTIKKAQTAGMIVLGLTIILTALFWLT